ncbi:MAG: hypothetical protein COA52_16225 [Hyphomicrobiales bacterium]|nr:MAG: hypothetical protein COA52_16225 [Hyphomicrobiales bacterium]
MLSPTLQQRLNQIRAERGRAGPITEEDIVAVGREVARDYYTFNYSPREALRALEQQWLEVRSVRRSEANK